MSNPKVLSPEELVVALDDLTLGLGPETEEQAEAWVDIERSHEALRRRVETLERTGD